MSYHAKQLLHMLSIDLSACSEYVRNGYTAQHITPLVVRLIAGDY